MRIMRATCDCGFHSRKARQGYHFHQWWFPVLVLDTGSLYDVSRSLPDDQIDQIQLSNIQAQELHNPFVHLILRELQAEFAGRDDRVFHPSESDTFYCPGCAKPTLRITPVQVRAICKRDCGYEYAWHDTETTGCPICNYRPHRFWVEWEEHFTGSSRTISACPCSSQLDSASHVDAYCPKCGGLPVSYSTLDQSFCGLHHTLMLPYKAPGNLFFIEPPGRWVADHFPNAKFWGESNATDALASKFCPNCQADYQSWLKSEQEAEQGA